MLVGSFEELMRTALDRSEARGAEIEVVSVDTVPQQTPLSAGRRFVDEERIAIDQAIDFVHERQPDLDGGARGKCAGSRHTTDHQQRVVRNRVRRRNQVE